MITGFYAGLLGLILVVLILQVVMRRWKFKVGLGDGGIPELEQRIRAHANFIETVPFLLILLYLVETAGYPDLLVHIFGITMVIARALHAAGLYMSKGTSFGRMAGTIMTCSLLIVGSLLLLYDFMFGDYVS